MAKPEAKRPPDRFKAIRHNEVFDNDEHRQRRILEARTLMHTAHPPFIHPPSAELILRPNKKKEE